MTCVGPLVKPLFIFFSDDKVLEPFDSEGLLEILCVLVETILLLLSDSTCRETFLIDSLGVKIVLEPFDVEDLLEPPGVLDCDGVFRPEDILLSLSTFFFFCFALFLTEPEVSSLELVSFDSDDLLELLGVLVTDNALFLLSDSCCSAYLTELGVGSFSAILLKPFDVEDLLELLCSAVTFCSFSEPLIPFQTVLTFPVVPIDGVFPVTP